MRTDSTLQCNCGTRPTPKTILGSAHSKFNGEFTLPDIKTDKETGTDTIYTGGDFVLIHWMKKIRRITSITDELNEKQLKYQ